MKKSGFLISSIMIITLILFTGCGGKSNVDLPKISSKYNMGNINLRVQQFHEPEIKYHTKAELNDMFKNGLVKKLDENNFISDNSRDNVLTVGVSYQRRFLGDETPIKSDSLGAPRFTYSIEIRDKNNKTLRELIRTNQIYSGGFLFNLKIIAGQVKEKKYEKDFIEALVNKIYKDIENIK